MPDFPKPQKLTGLWTNVTKDGKTYLSGKSKDGRRFSIWPNGYKEQDGDNAADYVLFVSEPND